MRITVLLENTAGADHVTAEHGLSLFIETESAKILFDMGQTYAFTSNAEVLGVDLASADLAVLSHGHYDHGGGLAKFLDLNGTAPVYLSPHAFEPHFSTKYIGLDTALESHPRLIRVTETTEIAPGVTLFPSVLCRYPIVPFGLTAEIDGIRKDEDFRHEQYMMIEEKGRRILFSGCSHRGILNIADHFGRMHGVDTVIGGFHFSKLDPDGDGCDALDEAAEILLDSGLIFYTCHCTGESQTAYLKSRMGDRLQAIRCGDSFEI